MPTQPTPDERIVSLIDRQAAVGKLIDEEYAVLLAATKRMLLASRELNYLRTEIQQLRYELGQAKKV